MMFSEKAMAALAALPLTELDYVAGLRIGSDLNGSHDLAVLGRDAVSGLRDAIEEAHKYGDSPDELNVHELADGLVPIPTYDAVRLFAIMPAAWSADVDEVGEYIGRLTPSVQSYGSRDTAVGPVIDALYLTFREALETLAGWLVELSDDEDDTDTEEDTDD
jgi:hypothetical protein